MTLSHAFSCGVADGTVTAVVRPVDWNAAHTVEAGTAGYGLIPVGGVIHWGGLIASMPSGYVLCDGASLLRVGTYANLYAAIGSIFGSADGDHFNVPDLRDKFIVGGKQDDASVVKSNIRGSLEQSITVTGVTLTHDGSISDHTGLTHAGAALSHPDLTHSALGIDNHAANTFSITMADHAVYASINSKGGANIAVDPAHTITQPTRPAITHTITQAGTHTATALTHSLTQAAAHGAAGVVAHSFTAPASHTASIVPAFLALAMAIRYA